MLAKLSGSLELRRPAVLVLLSSSDTTNCCAANYERTVFRDAKVVALSKRFVCVRMDRTSLDPALVKRLGVQTGKPALVVLDAEGRCFARWQLCANARDVAWVMQRTLRRSRKMAKAAATMAKRFEAIEAALEQDDVRAAGKLLRRFKRIKGGPISGYQRAEAMLGAWVKNGQDQVEAAAADADVAQRWARLQTLRAAYDLQNDLARDIRRRLKALADGAETGPVVREHMANEMIDEALALIAKGDGLRGRNLLRKVGREHPGGAAAERAERELRRHTP